jgi:hypothetical protein
MNTEKLRDEILEIRTQLRDGSIANNVARSLILAAKVELDTLKAEMEAARLGVSFQSIDYHGAERKRHLRSVG